jgi:hypothetical protein
MELVLVQVYEVEENYIYLEAWNVSNSLLIPTLLLHLTYFWVISTVYL